MHATTSPRAVTAMVRVPRRYKGADYVVTANEGDGREWPGLRDDAARVKEIAAKLDPAAFPDAATLVQDANLGRLRVLARRFATAAASVKHAPCGSCMQGHSVVHTQAASIPSSGGRSLHVHTAAHMGGLVSQGSPLHSPKRVWRVPCKPACLLTPVPVLLFTQSLLPGPPPRWTRHPIPLTATPTEQASSPSW